MTRGARVASVVVAVLLVASLATAGGTSTGGATTERVAALASAASETLGVGGGPTVSRTVGFDRRPSDPGNVTVSVDYEVGDGVEALVVTSPDGATVEAADGFARDDQYRGWAYEWDGETETPSLTATVPVNASSGAFSGLDFADTGSWAMLRSTEGVRGAFYGGDEWVYSWRGDDRFRTEFASAGPGHLSHGMGFLGAYETHSGRAGDQTFTLVVPDAASPTATPAETFALLAESRGAFRFGGVDDHVDAYVGPNPLRDGGYYRAPASFWVNEDSLGNAGTLVHEYVHTRQAYRAADAMDWFDEGSANYYRELFEYEQGLQSYDAFRSAVVSDGRTTGVLADRETWSAPDLEYHRGERVAAALDARIREATGGERTLQDVLRRMNDHDGEVTYEAFRGLVAAVAGTSLDGWLDAYVQSGALPRVPDDPDRYALPSPGVDSDGDGLANAAERERGTSVTDPDTDGDGLADGADPAPADASVPATTTGQSGAAAEGSPDGGESSAGGGAAGDGDSGTGAESPGFDARVALAAVALGFAVASRGAVR